MRTTNIMRLFLLAGLLEGTAAALTAQNFVKYYDYVGNLIVGGSVTVTTQGTVQTLQYSLTNVDTQCAAGPGNAANSCGVHIHEGTSCALNAGGHYYSGATDPWTTVTYTATGQTSTGNAIVNSGATEAQATGRTMIIHNYDGGRIACALLATGLDGGSPGSCLSQAHGEF